MLEAHEGCHLFPMMTEDEYTGLLADMRVNGQREPILLHEGRIVDGRNRYRACTELGIEPFYTDWQGNGSVIDLVVSLNLHRRHLTASQRAALAVELESWYATEAKQRQIALAGTRPNTSPDLVPRLVQGDVDRGRARDKAATSLGVSGGYVQDAKRLAAEAPELLEKVKAGDLTIPQAKRDLRQSIAPATPVPLPDGLYQCIEADPPWALDASEVKSAITQYAVMSLEALCAMADEILQRAAPNCHLWLWAINPMLPEALQLMEAWGFAYKACLTWVKTNGFGTGHYLRGATEHCLLGVRGTLSCLRHDQRTYFEAVRTEHSVKPDAFYEAVETLSPGPRLRLFARKERDGWTSWGLEL